MVGEALLLPDKVLYGVKPGSGKGFQSFISVIVHVDLRSDPSESKTVGNYKGIHPIILWQVWISLLEFADLLWVDVYKRQTCAPTTQKPTILPGWKRKFARWKADSSKANWKRLSS